jgi:hypothetical protein
MNYFYKCVKKLFEGYTGGAVYYWRIQAQGQNMKERSPRTLHLSPGIPQYSLFFSVLGFKLRAYTLNHSTSPFL